MSSRDWLKKPYQRSEFDVTNQDHARRIAYIERTGMFLMSVMPMKPGDSWVYFHRIWTEQTEQEFKAWVERGMP